jgi:hypothetical protein
MLENWAVCSGHEHRFVAAFHDDPKMTRQAARLSGTIRRVVGDAVIRFAFVVLLTGAFAGAVQADDPLAQKRRAARAAAVAMVQPSGPLRIDDPASRTPDVWRARPRIVGVYQDYSTRHRFVLSTGFYYYGYGWYPGFGGWRWSGGFFGRGTSGVGIGGYSTW